MDEECERFKQSIHLVSLAEAYGYRVTADRGGIIEMRHDDGDKINIRPHADGHLIFKSWEHGHGKGPDAVGQGSVIDFVKYRDHCTPGHARVILRQWSPSPFFPSARSTPAPTPAPKPFNRAAFVEAWRHFRPYAGGYLESRGITAATLATAADRLRLDERGNVAFRHDDLEGITGWELKNRRFTGFAGGGRKALFALRVGYGRDEPPPRLVVTESGLDALSFHQIDPAPALLLSFGGGLSDQQHELLRHVLTKYPAAAVLAATDNDKQGEKYAALVASIRPDATRAKSPRGNDWNDAIRPRKHARELLERGESPATVAKLLNVCRATLLQKV